MGRVEVLLRTTLFTLPLLLLPLLLILLLASWRKKRCPGAGMTATYMPAGGGGGGKEEEEEEKLRRGGMSDTVTLQI